jgi:integrase
MAKALTDIAIKNLKAGPKAREIADGRGLYVWIGESGIRSFVVRYRYQGRTRKLTLGRWIPPEDRRKEGRTAEPKVGEPMSLLQARKLATDVMVQVARGGDPAADKQQNRLDTKQAMADTFEAIASTYMERDGSKLRSARNLDRMLRRHAFLALGDIPIALLKKSHVVSLLDQIENQSGPVAADRLLALIRRILHWHAERSDDYEPPLLRLKPRKSASEQARDRVLDDRELAAVWKVSGEWDDPFAKLVRFLLLTAARRNEAALMAWSEIDDGVWTLPAARNKAAARSSKVKDLVRPLSRMAKEALPSRIEGCKYVFTYDGRRGMTGFSKPKRRFDERVAKVLGEPIQNWTLHDLRRTARSLMARADVVERHAEQCLGHVITGVQGVYNRYDYLAEMRSAYEKLAAMIETIVNPPTDNVVAFLKAGE